MPINGDTGCVDQHLKFGLPRCGSGKLRASAAYPKRFGNAVCKFHLKWVESRLHDSCIHACMQMHMRLTHACTHARI